jgi:hypothetical protein
MNTQVSLSKNGRESDGKVGRYTAHVYTQAVEGGLKVVYASLWAGQHDFCSLEGMADEVYSDISEIFYAVRELADTENVDIELFPAIDFN